MGYPNDSSVYRHFNVAKELEEKMSDMVIFNFNKNEIKKFKNIFYFSYFFNSITTLRASVLPIFSTT